MKILVCLKQILDPDIPARDFAIDGDARSAVRGSADLVTSIFCENALETALQFREAAGDVSITALSVGTEEAEEVLRKALALKVDVAALVLHEGDGDPAPDAAGLARVLAAAARQLDEDGSGFDLVMVGRESGDWGGGQTGGLLAEELGLPFVAFVDHVESAGSSLRLRRQTDVGTEILEADGPVVVSITNCDGNLPRIPKTRDVMKSYRKPLTTLGLADLGLDADALGEPAHHLAELFVPEKGAECEIVDGDSLDARVDAFARRIVTALGGAA